MAGEVHENMIQNSCVHNKSMWYARSWTLIHKTNCATISLCTNLSELKLTCSITSGAIQQGVPTNVCRTFCLERSLPVANQADTPKSAICTVPSSPSKMLPAFTSLQCSKNLFYFISWHADYLGPVNNTLPCMSLPGGLFETVHMNLIWNILDRHTSYN
jgi:hypothetical protein